MNSGSRYKNRVILNVYNRIFCSALEIFIYFYLFKEFIIFKLNCEGGIWNTVERKNKKRSEKLKENKE